MKIKGIDARNVHTCQLSGRKFYQILVTYGTSSRVKKVWIG